MNNEDFRPAKTNRNYSLFILHYSFFTIHYAFSVNAYGLSRAPAPTKPPSGREVSQSNASDGRSLRDFGFGITLAGRVLPQSPAATAPSRREPFSLFINRTSRAPAPTDNPSVVAQSLFTTRVDNNRRLMYNNSRPTMAR